MSQLAPYASFPDHSRGRLHAEPKSDIRGPRDIFQRDRDRIIHSMAIITAYALPTALRSRRLAALLPVRWG